VNLDSLVELPEPVQSEVDASLCDAIAEAETKLSERDRLILEMHYSRARLPLSDIAGLLGVAPGTVRARHKRALARLRRLLDGAMGGGFVRRAKEEHNTKTPEFTH
jgi:RNA polymerase sigma factor (sigma-70 family)